MLSVDLSLAFDRVGHQYLNDALRFLGVEPDTIALIILSIHRAKYHVQHGQQASNFNICNGIRQGCTLSPLLWVCLTHYMMHRFELKAGREARESLILFADDFLAKFILHDMQDVHALTMHVRALFETLEEANMTANPEKSKLHIKAVGVPMKKWLRARTVTHKGAKCLIIRTPFTALFLPLCDSLTYLGAVVSYGAYEDQTAEHRVRSAQANVARLAKHLFTQHGISLRVRLRLFLTCVRSSLLYGITSVGTTSKSLSVLQRFEAKHVRRLARSPVHMTLELTQDLYQRLQIPTLHEALKSRATNSLESCEKPFLYPGRHTVTAWLHQKLHDLTECIQLTQTSLAKVTPDGTRTDGVPCPVCGIYFNDQHAMRAHATQRHAMIFTTQLTTDAGRNIDPRSRMTEPTQAELEIAAQFASAMPALAAAKSARRADSDAPAERSKLMLKHEDILAAYQAVTQTWQTKKRDSPESLTQSLRVTLLTALFMELRERMNMALKEDKRATLSKHSWLSESDPATWSYQKWDPATETVVVDAGKVGLQHKDALHIIQRVLQLIPETILIQKFHSTRPQAAEYKSNVLPFMLMVSNRGPLAQELYELFQKLSDLSAMRLIGSRIRPHRQRRQPLAVTLEQLTSGLLQAASQSNRKDEDL
ncbi:unnamed protein product [Symbiodinium sp. CCMP2456]|nr:unnamed protein product [Symbiodinium sp. CCMP2456]